MRNLEFPSPLNVTAQNGPKITITKKRGNLTINRDDELRDMVYKKCYLDLSDEEYAALALTKKKRKEIDAQRERVLAFEDEKKSRSKERDSKNRPVLLRMTYDDLAKYLACVDLTIKDYYVAVLDGNAKEKLALLSWQDGVISDMAELLDSLTETQRLEAVELIKSSVSPYKRNANLKEYKTMPGARLFHHLEIQIVDQEDVRAGFEPEGTLYGDTERRLSSIRVAEPIRNLVDITVLPFLAKKYGVSLHFLLGFDESVPVIAKYGLTEKAMDYFCLMKKDEQEALYHALSKFYLSV